jgi:DNA-binding transcriptional LysR family regulator
MTRPIRTNVVRANLNDLELLVCIAETGSFTESAIRLGISKSLASKRLGQLEARLGVTMIERSTRSLRLTPAGQACVDHARAALQSARAAERAAQYYQSTARGSVRLAAPMAFGTRFVAPKLGEFHAAYPHVAIDLWLDDSLKNSDVRDFDISLVIDPPSQQSMVFRRLQNLSSVLVGLPSITSQISSLNDLAGKNCLALQRPGERPIWRLESPEGNEVNIEPRGSLLLNNSDALCAAVMSGLGIARLPTFIAGPLIESRKLAQVLPTYKLASKALYLAFPEGADTAPAVRALADFLTRTILSEFGASSSSASVQNR